MTDDRPITPEQALLAVKGAGLDPDKPLNEQLNGPAQLDEQERQGLGYRSVSEAMGAGQGSSGEPTDPQQPHQRFAENYRDALNRSRTRWFGEGRGGVRAGDVARPAAQSSVISR